jgi:hypothetical protein
MALPKIDLPVFELTLPSTEERIKYRPFTVKEEKILLVAQEAEDPNQEIIAARQVVNNCLIDKDVSELSMFDLEFILLILRSRSVDNKISFTIKDLDTSENIELELDIDEINIHRDPEHTKEIKINDDYTLFLKYPCLDDFIKISDMDMNDPLSSYYIVISCLDFVASEDEIYRFSDYTQEDIDNFMEGVSGDVVQKIQKFFSTMPKVKHELKYTNKEGNEKTFLIEGSRTFFI